VALLCAEYFVHQDLLLLNVSCRCCIATPFTAADIVVATPGRLIAHLEGTPGFSLSHLRFLIVDETDRLLRQAYQGWLPKVMAALQGSGSCGSGADTPAETPAAVLAAAAVLPGEQQQGRALGHRVVKLVVSATLTHDPSKIDRLGLYCPRYIATSAGAWHASCCGVQQGCVSTACACPLSFLLSSSAIASYHSLSTPACLSHSLILLS
jgi:ATP-dependent RNA helicase DDX51/DBP6